MRDFILTLFTCSISVSALGLLLIAATPLLAKRYTAKTRYYMWLIIVFSLLTPFHPPRFFENAVIEVNIPAEALSVMSPVDTGYVVITPEARLAGITPAEAAPFLLRFSPRQLLTALWVAGALAFLMYHADKHLRLIRAIRRWSEPVTGGDAFQLLQTLREERGMRGRVELLRCPCVSGPMAMGLIRHRVLLPHTEYDPGELRYILGHELTHIRRRDLWYRALTLLATATHWFNPLVYWMGSRIDLLCEISCDSEIVRNTDADARMRYTETIIGVAARRSRVSTALSTGFYAGKKGMKARISSIMDTGKKRAGPLLVAGVLAVTLVAGSVFTVAASPENAGSAPVTLTADMIESILSNRYGEGSNAIPHSPMPGEIDMDQAIAIAKASIPRYLQRFIVGGEAEPVEISTVSGELIEYSSHSVEEEEFPLDHRRDYYILNFRGAGEGALSIFVMIHAETRLITSFTIYGLEVDAGTELSPERLLSCYMEGLGAGGFVPSGEYDQTSEELTETRIAKNIVGGAAQAQIHLQKGPLWEDAPAQARDSLSATITCTLEIWPPDTWPLS